MSDKSLSLDSKPHELKFGASFDSKSGVAYHSIRCKISLMFSAPNVILHA